MDEQVEQMSLPEGCGFHKILYDTTSFRTTKDGVSHSIVATVGGRKVIIHWYPEDGEIGIRNTSRADLNTEDILFALISMRLMNTGETMWMSDCQKL